MKNKILATSVIVLLITICLTSSFPFTHAVGEGQWITAYTIEDANGEVLAEFNAATGVNRTLSSVLPGTEIKVTFTVNVFASGADTLKLTTGLGKSTSHPSGYWELLSDDYDMGTSFNPASASTSFKWTIGTFDIALYGKVPSTGTSAAKTVSIVTLSSGTATTPIDQITVRATSSGMANFNTLYANHQDALDNMVANGVDPYSIQTYENMLDVAAEIAESGDPESAVAILNGLDQAGAPPSAGMQAIFLPLIVVMAVLAVIFVVLFMRIRGKLSYFQLVVEDQVKDLEGLTLRASKIDRAMSASLDSVKDRLKRLVGGG
ncbi:MAG: hypothetical protein ACM3JE_02120 [Betaproteobacteria bacterium]